MSELKMCNVCCDDTKKMVKCLFCSYEACVKCNHRYLLSTPNDACCMNCKGVWSRDFIANNLTVSFLNGAYKKHRENTLFDREKARFAEAAETAAQIKRAEKNYNELMSPIIALDKQMNALKKQLDTLKKQRDALYSNIGADVRWDMTRHIERLWENGPLKTDASPSPTKLCMVEDCRGVLSKDGECGLCETHFCLKCHYQVTNDKEHTCDKNAVKTVALLKRDTKQCPECGEGVYRIHGCPQMWCTACNTPFDWNTGKVIVRGFFHNPHYFEWVERTGNRFTDRVGGGDHDDRGRVNRCGTLPGVNHVIDILNNCDRDGAKERNNKVRALYRLVNEHRDRMIHNPLQEPNNHKLRINLVMGLMTEAKFKKEIQKREKKYHKQLEYNLVWDSFCMSVIDILNNMLVNETRALSYFTSIDDLIQYTNENFARLGKLFKNKCPCIVYETRKFKRYRRATPEDVTRYYYD